jgi:hypothetical protein
MLKQRREAAELVASRLFALEDAIDTALACAADFTATMPVARRNAKLSAVVGQDAVALSAEIVSYLVKARGRMVKAHERLDVTKTKIGLREVSIGDVLDKPEVTGHSGSRLRAVA